MANPRILTDIETLESNVDALKTNVRTLETNKLDKTASCNKNWNWNGQGGQPSWLWGSNDGTNMYVYNPSNFNVANADTVDGLHGYQLGTLNAIGNSHGTAYPAYMTHNAKGDSRFFLGVDGHETSVNYAYNADTVDGVHLHPGNDVPLISTPSPYVYAFKGGDDHNCYVKNLADVTVGNANRLEGNPSSNFMKTTGGSMKWLALTDYGTPFECSQYLDFHEVGSNVDFSTRLFSSGGGLHTTGGISAGDSNGNLKRTTISTAAPSGGANGDIWIQYS